MAESKYADWMPDHVRRMAREGLDAAQMARVLGVHKATLYRWREAHPELAEAMEEGRAVADSRVINTLYRLAMGFTYTEQRTTSAGKVVDVRLRHLPELKAIMFWLQNRLGDGSRVEGVALDSWRNVSRHEVGGKVDLVTVDQIDRTIAALEEELARVAAEGDTSGD